MNGTPHVASFQRTQSHTILIYDCDDFTCRMSFIGFLSQKQIWFPWRLGRQTTNNRQRILFESGFKWLDYTKQHQWEYKVSDQSLKNNSCTIFFSRNILNYSIGKWLLAGKCELSSTPLMSPWHILLCSSFLVGVASILYSVSQYTVLLIWCILCNTQSQNSNKSVSCLYLSLPQFVILDQTRL